MARPDELREESRLMREAAKREIDPRRRVELAGRALQLAFLAEKIEKDEAAQMGGAA